MIPGLPPYKPPIEQGLRCTCWTRYIIFLGGAGRFDESLCNAAREHAEILKAIFVDARSTPFMQCVSCGGVLDFSIDSASMVM